MLVFMAKCNEFLWIFILQSTWNEGLKLAGLINFKFPTMVSTNLHSIIPNASVLGVNLVKQLLIWDPQKRLTATQVSK